MNIEIQCYKPLFLYLRYSLSVNANWLWPCEIFDLLTENLPYSYRYRGYRTSSSTRYLSILSNCSFMETWSVQTNEHFMVCFCSEKHEISKLPVTFLLVFMFQLSNCLTSFKENYYELTIIAKHVENSCVLGCHTARSGNFLWNVRDILSFPLHVSGIQNISKYWIPVYSETSVTNYHYSLLNNPAEGSSHLLRGKPEIMHKTSYFVISVMNA
jgi:hypothetical protein